MRHVQARVLDAREPNDTLVIVLHGCVWTGRQKRLQLQHVIGAIHDTIPSADVFAPLLPIEFWSLRNADRIIDALLAQVDDLWSARGERYARVILVGFSFGSVLVRSLYCRAAGAGDDGVVDPRQCRPWAAAVERVVLLAGVNRGWTTDSPVTKFESLVNGVGTAVGHLLPAKPTIFALRRGAPFLTTMRLQWLALSRAGLGPAMTIQLLGTRDDIVSPEDNVDLATGSGFHYVDVPRSSHFDVIDMGPTGGDRSARYQAFQVALRGTDAELSEAAVPLAAVQQLLPVSYETTSSVATAAAADSVTDVVFVVHGIRDKGYWTRKIARVVVQRGGGMNRTVVAMTPTYGYFALLPFVLPWTRRAKREWLLDMYVNARSAYPNACVSFIGHSNGTYILASALVSCRAVRVNNVVFAGSVVPSRYPWRALAARGQVQGKVLNYVATADYVVAWFPRMFNRVGVRDLGGAGFDGFEVRGAGVHNVEHVVGGHSAALDEQHWTDMAEFVLSGTPPLARPARSPWQRWAAAVLPFVVWTVIAFGLAAPTYLLLRMLGFPQMPGTVRGAAIVPPAPWLWALLLFVWLRLVAMVLTRL